MELIELVLGVAAIVGAFSGLAAWIAQLSRQAYARERELAHLKRDIQSVSHQMAELMDRLDDKSRRNTME